MPNDEKTLTTPPALAAGAALFLDFDGTLVPIAPRPQDVRVPSGILPVLRRLLARLDNAVGILSGRPLDQIDDYLQPLRLSAAGVHGLERRRADGQTVREATEPPAAVLGAMTSLARSHPRLLVETKPGAVALHYRAAPELAVLCRSTLEAALRDAQGWSLLPGHAVLEVKPSHLSKASALQAFMNESPFAGRVPVVVGDDVTDEDAMRAADGAGGYGIRVGAGQSRARFRLADPADVERWLVRSAEALESGDSGALAGPR